MKYDELNKEQLAAVQSDHRRILTLAGAGTGKTKTMITRVARLLEDGVKPENMLVLTFTNAAAEEMKERLFLLTGEEKVHMSTFHSWAVKEIRRYGRALGYDPTFSIYDQEDTLSIVNAIIQELQYNMNAADVVKAMEKRSVYGVPIPAGDIEKIVTEYQFRCRQQNAIDIDGLISTLQAMLRNETIHHLLRSQYKYVFVDEFQDTDPRQMALLATLDPENLFVVGDDFQSIYGFRGSDVNIIMSLAEDPEWQTIKLEENYRSTLQIVDAANRLIIHNKQTEKVLKAHRDGTYPATVHYSDNMAERDGIASVAWRFKAAQGCNWDDIAVLSRTNKQVEAIAEALHHWGIPYEIRRRTPDVLNTMEAKKIAQWMDAALNPLDDEAIRAVINWPKETIKRRDLLKVEMWQLENNCSLLTALEANNEAEQFRALLRMIQDDIEYHKDDASNAVEIILYRTQIDRIFKEQGLSNRCQRLDDIEDLICAWAIDRSHNGEPQGIEDWLEFYKLRLVSGEERREHHEDAVQIMTAHGSKGLEFKNVIISGCNQKSFPMGRGDIEEERRLFYVAMTRAKDNLIMTRSCTRQIFGDKVEEAEMSIFLQEIE